MLDAALLFLINVLWAAAYPMAKFAISGGVPSVTLAWARWAIALLVLPLFARFVLRVPLGLPRHDLLRALALGATALGLVHILVFVGLRYTTAVDATLLLAGEPLVMAVMAVLLLREGMSRRSVLGLVSGFAGVYLLINRGLLPPLDNSGTLLGNLLVAASVLVEGTGTVLSRGLTRRYSGIVVLFWESVGATLALAIPAYLFWASSSVVPAAAALGAVLYLGVVNSAFCYAVWFVLMERHHVGNMGVFIFVQPVFGALMGVLWLKEPLGVYTAIGSAMVLSGVWLTMRATVDERVETHALR
ncbi:MAG: DMT family transporter [Armatimonadota bacterium]|nr:DMT family transporter [bacterium]MDW8320634.1 DMT family transporter [Armatimonadota bacterium]